MWEIALLSLRPGDAQAGRLSARRLVLVPSKHEVACNAAGRGPTHWPPRSSASPRCHRPRAETNPLRRRSRTRLGGHTDGRPQPPPINADLPAATAHALLASAPDALTSHNAPYHPPRSPTASFTHDPG